MSTLSIDAADREHPPRPAVLVRLRRAAVALFALGLVGAVSTPGSFLWNDRTDVGLGIACVLTMAIAVTAIVRIDRRLLHAADAWRAQRRADRDPAFAEPTRVGTPRSIRRDPDAPRASRLLGGQGRLARAIEKVLIVYLVIGFPLCGALFGQLAIFAYPGFALALLAAQEASDRRISRGMRGPANPKASRELRKRLAGGRAWWAASPPPVLKGMRWAFGAFAGLGFYLCIVHPALEGADPAARYRATLPFVVGFLVGIVLLAFAERAQRRVELR